MNQTISKKLACPEREKYAQPFCLISQPLIVWLTSLLAFTSLIHRCCSHTFFKFLIGCRSANSWTGLNGLVLSGSRQMGCRSLLNTGKKKGTEKEACVCEVEREREIVLIKQHKRKPSFILWAPGDRL